MELVASCSYFALFPSKFSSLFSVHARRTALLHGSIEELASGGPIQLIVVCIQHVHIAQLQMLETQV